MTRRIRRSLAVGFALLGGASTPALAQTVCTPFDQLPGTVLRDAHGVPHIFAGSLDDLSFTNGYVEAQDRLFEMEILRRAGKGTLSEVLGASFLEMDSSTRRDLYTPAERQAHFDALAAADRQTIGRFADGVNLYICQAKLDPSKLPAEYAALGFLPADWTALDTVAAAEYLVGVFGAFGGDEVHNAAFFFDVKSRLRRTRAKHVFDDHFPLFDPQSPTTIPQLEKTYDDPLRHSTRPFAGRQLRLLERYLPSINAAAGLSSAQAQARASSEEQLGVGAARRHLASNAILVSGALTDTGNPILLGGPQVGYAIPSFFFEVGLHAPGIDAVGVIPPAGPGIVIGRTQNFAYTITSGISDQVDTYLEVLNPSNAKQYLFNGVYHDMTCRTETFTVQEPPPPAGSGGAPMTVEREFCRTLHGPVFFSDPARGAAFSHAYAHRNLELL
ncbi:MAG: penicillin acylase family protein, partial [Deltaproteobacteria bacterium]